MTASIEQHRFAMRPGRWVLFLRTFLPFQIYRFLWINLRMLVMIRKSHGHAHARSHAQLPSHSPAH